MENNSKHPEVSILVFIYEYSLSLKYTINSILEQTVTDFELIIVSNIFVVQLKFLLNHLNNNLFQNNLLLCCIIQKVSKKY